MQQEDLRRRRLLVPTGTYVHTYVRSNILRIFDVMFFILFFISLFLYFFIYLFICLFPIPRSLFLFPYFSFFISNSSFFIPHSSCFLIVIQGDKPDCLYILLTGQLSLVKEIKLVCRNSWPTSLTDREYLTRTKTKRILLRTLSE